MKKVLFITTISGFLPQFEKNDVKLLQRMGCEIHYASNFRNPIYTFQKEKLKDEGVFLHDIDIAKSPVKIKSNGKAVRQLQRIIEKYKIDLIHCHNPMGGVAARIAARMGKRKTYVIYTAHGFHFYRGAPLKNWLLYYPVERFLARYTDQILTINREDYLLACRFSLKRGGSITQIHGVGVDSERFRPNPKAAQPKRQELGVPAGAFHIVTAAELNENKNQRVVIEAIDALADKNVYYSICGTGPWEAKLQKLVRQKKLERQVRFLGFCTDMEEVLQTADCFAFPSVREGLGVAAVEALLCGVPLIVSDNRGSREYALDGMNSIVCRADSIEEFREAIMLLSQDKAKRDHLASHCRQSAMGFTIGEVEKKMRQVYQSALNALQE